MNGFGMYQGKKFQDEQRKKLLTLLEVMIHGDEDMLVMYTGMYAWAFCEGMGAFRDQLDLHNRCLLSNAEFQSDKILKGLKSRRVEREREMKDAEDKNDEIDKGSKETSI